MTVASLLKQQRLSHRVHRQVASGHGLGDQDRARKCARTAASRTAAQVWNVDFAKPIANGPNASGFDYYFGISASLDMVPYTFIENDRVTVAADGGSRLPDDVRPRPRRHTTQGQPRRLRRGRRVAHADGKAVRVHRRVRRKRRDGNRSFCTCRWPRPTRRSCPPPAWQGKSGMNPYADFVMQTDAAIGQILAALDRHQLADNTLVIVTSDNGCSPQAQFDELAAEGASSERPLSRPQGGHLRRRPPHTVPRPLAGRGRCRRPSATRSSV